jgi:hypothetical protein
MQQDIEQTSGEVLAKITGPEKEPINIANTANKPRSFAIRFCRALIMSPHITSDGL